MKTTILMLIVIMFISLTACTSDEAPKATPPEFAEEIFYHMHQRSFYDSNGDSHGDLNGITAKLDYLQELGVTSILLTPLYESGFYHNYFADNFETIDPEYGTKDDYFRLVEALHQRGMKLYMDIELHYVTYNHHWYKDSHQNPASEFSNYIIYNGPDNSDPESIIFGLKSLKSYDGTEIGFTSIDLYDPDVKAYHLNLLKYWIDPNQDGDFSDGVDGYRMDHIMDDLDWKGIRTNLLTDFWRPILQELRKVNPKVKVIGEQAEWGYGRNYLVKGDLDAVFAFPLHDAARHLNAAQIASRTDSTWQLTPAGKHQLVFIENHDTDRFASFVENHPASLRAGAALTLLQKGIPSIYYGQELGMTGEKYEWGITDANDIPRREAFEWYKTVNGEGMALWYKDSGPWWDDSNLKENDGISLEEQKADSSSLWHYYRSLIDFRKQHPTLARGSAAAIENGTNDVLTMVREWEGERLLVAINLSNEDRGISISSEALSEGKALSAELLYPRSNATIDIAAGTTLSRSLPPGEAQVFRLISIQQN